MTPALKELARRPSRWLDASGPHSEVVLSTRVRLARNVLGAPFTHRAREEQLHQVLHSVVSAARRTGSLRDSVLLRMGDLAGLDRQFLVERHLVSHDLVEGSSTRGLLLGPDETASIMINEEDHLRLQVIHSGFQLAESWRSANHLDDELDGLLDYAFSEELGYLTACPTNAGTGLRCSVLIHLPALVLTKQITKVLQGVTQVGLAVRGFYGEGSEVMGNFFQVSNQTTLGHREKETAENLERVTRQLIEYEEKAREVLLRDARLQIEDKIYRALGTLAYCRSIGSQETLNLSSAVRFGVALELPGLPPLPVLNEILVFSQPAHLQRMLGREIGPTERNVARAEYVRGRLNSNETRADRA
ncbi:MAG: protein arginine kinase [Candidatus Eisenbacteria bacterium]|nr:protein arginine kinase [Candidatus Eisenbacteria bacterium]